MSDSAVLCHRQDKCCGLQGHSDWEDQIPESCLCVQQTNSSESPCLAVQVDLERRPGMFTSLSLLSLSFPLSLTHVPVRVIFLQIYILHNETRGETKELHVHTKVGPTLDIQSCQVVIF